MPPGRLAIAFAGFLVAGCVTSREAAGPANVAPDWVSVTTPHLHLWAELDAASAANVGRGMEAVWSAVGAFWGPQLEVQDRLEVVAFSNPQSLASTFPSGVAAYLFEGTFDPWMVTNLNGVGARAIAAHELAHHLSAHQLQRQPHWLRDGLAMYLQTVEIDPSGASVTFGKPPTTIAPSDLTTNPLTLAQLWAWGSVD